MLIEWFLFSFLDGVLDAGGSILVHMFAAYWGWGVILGLRNKAVNNEPAATSVHSVSFVWLASMLLMVLWPSFVTALLPPEDVIPGMANTYLAMVASILVTYLILWAMKRTIDPLVFTYAILAGGVAIGASVDLATPLQSWIIGLVAGAVSTLSFLFLDEWLRNKTGVWDTMGVHNLHGVPGIVGDWSPSCWRLCRWLPGARGGRHLGHRVGTGRHRGSDPATVPKTNHDARRRRGVPRRRDARNRSCLVQ